MSWRDVFDAQRIFPCDYQECRVYAERINYKYFAFNGSVYNTSDLNMRNPICEVEDLV